MSENQPMRLRCRFATRVLRIAAVCSVCLVPDLGVSATSDADELLRSIPGNFQFAAEQYARLLLGVKDDPKIPRMVLGPQSLATRFNPAVGLIRLWDHCNRSYPATTPLALVPGVSGAARCEWEFHPDAQRWQYARRQRSGRTVELRGLLFSESIAPLPNGDERQTPRRKWEGGSTCYQPQIEAKQLT